ncbi:MAG: leucine-rich repeat domain-containing protein, partial [Clostridia bacterium]|nr:leucine-rich repeat domain-containing protein [Clostridia bacterium]
KRLKEVNLPDGIGKIPEFAFQGCTLLETFSIPESVMTVENNAFCNCRALKDIVIPDGVKTIGQDAFRNCISLERMTIGKGVEYIDSGAILDCPLLHELYYRGNESEWTEVGIGFFNEALDFGLGLSYYSEDPPAVDGGFWHYDKDGNPQRWPFFRM